MTVEQDFKWRWVCPKCGTEWKAGDPDIPGDAPPPTCGWGHKPTEMEQRLALSPEDSA